MAEVFTINKTGILEFENNRFKVNNSNDKLKSVGERITDYITLSIHNFIARYDYLGDNRKFIFVCHDRTLSDGFFEVKNKIELFSYNFDEDGCFKRFTIDFIKLIKSIEEYLKLSPNFKKKGYLTYVYDFGELIFTSRYYQNSNVKLVRLNYKGSILAEFTEYIDFGIKIIGYTHSIFSTWDIEIQNYVYNFYLFIGALNAGIRMDDAVIGWISELEKYVISKM